MPKTGFDTPEIVRFGPFFPNTFYVVFSVVFGPLPRKHREARIRHLDLKPPGTSRICRPELNTLRIVEDLAPGPKKTLEWSRRFGATGLQSLSESL